MLTGKCREGGEEAESNQPIPPQPNKMSMMQKDAKKLPTGRINTKSKAFQLTILSIPQKAAIDKFSPILLIKINKADKRKNPFKLSLFPPRQTHSWRIYRGIITPLVSFCTHIRALTAITTISSINRCLSPSEIPPCS